VVEGRRAGEISLPPPLAGVASVPSAVNVNVNVINH
jgi:hypothetical protein